MESLNRDLVAIHSWRLKWHLRLKSKKTKSMAVSRSWSRAPSYGDLTLIVAELEELKSCVFLG